MQVSGLHEHTRLEGKPRDAVVARAQPLDLGIWPEGVVHQVTRHLEHLKRSVLCPGEHPQEVAPRMMFLPGTPASTPAHCQANCCETLGSPLGLQEVGHRLFRPEKLLIGWRELRHLHPDIRLLAQHRLLQELQREAIGRRNLRLAQLLNIPYHTNRQNHSCALECF